MDWMYLFIGLGVLAFLTLSGIGVGYYFYNKTKK
jgi:hypothetical protein